MDSGKIERRVGRDAEGVAAGKGLAKRKSGGWRRRAAGLR
jgi:hypothetical protein